jgi:hypothetical protein
MYPAGYQFEIGFNMVHGNRITLIKPGRK